MIKYKIKSAKDMTIDELIGQVIMVGLPGDYLDDDYKKFIKDKKIGNLNILKHYEVSDDCISFWENDTGGGYELIEQIKKDFGNQNDILYVVSAGPMSEVIISKLYKNNN